MKFKRLLSVLLSVCILCSLFVFSASADQYEDCIIKILALPELTVGEPIADVTLEVPSDAKYTVTGKWVEVKCNEYGEFATHAILTGGNFEEDKKYALHLYVEALPEWVGWVYADEDGDVWVDVYLEDEVLGCGFVWKTISDDGYYTISYDYLLGEYVKEVVIEGVSEIKAGDKASVENIKLSEEDKDVAEIYSAKWYEINIETNEATEFTGAFEKGKVYELSIHINTKTGYYFDDESEVLVNGEDSNIWYNKEPYTVIPNFRFDLREEITEVKLENIQEAKVGETATAEDIKAESGSKFTVKSAKWIETDSWEEVTGKFETKKEYELEIELEANEGCRFPEEEPEIYIGGVLADEDSVYFSYYDDEECTVNMKVDFYELIEVIEFTNSEVREVGKAPAADAVKAPEGVNYSFDAVTLYVPESDDEEAVVPDVYEDGKAYVTVIEVMANEGYKFSDKAVVKVNGEELDSSEYIVDIRDTIVWLDYVYFGKTPIDSIEVELVPLPDKTPADIKAQIPADANYSVEDIEWYDTETWKELEDTDKFEKGKKYNFYAIIKVKDGYYIPTDAKITLNGSDAYSFEDSYINVFIYNELSATLKSEVPVPATSDNTHLPVYALAFVLGLGALVIFRKKETA